MLFLTALAKVQFLVKRLDTRLCLHPNLRFFLIFLHFQIFHKNLRSLRSEVAQQEHAYSNIIYLFIYLFIFLFIYFHYGRQPLKNLKWYGLPQQTISLHFKFFKGCLPQILLGPFLKTLIHLIFRFSFRILGHSCDSVWVIYKD